MKTLLYFYCAHSAFAYLGSARLMEIAAAKGCRVIHKPFDLNRLLNAIGAPGFAERSPAHRAYFFGREIERWGHLRGLPIIDRVPTHHRKDYNLANRLLIAAQAAGHDVDALAHRFLEAHWRDDADLSDAESLRNMIAAVGLDAEALFAEAEKPETLALYEANTEEAIARGLFGSPAYVLDEDLFYGQDRLEMLERALDAPFPGRTLAQRLADSA